MEETPKGVGGGCVSSGSGRVRKEGQEDQGGEGKVRNRVGALRSVQGQGQVRIKGQGSNGQVCQGRSRIKSQGQDQGSRSGSRVKS